MSDRAKVVLSVSSDEMGRGDGELGKRLMKAFFDVLSESEYWPDCIVFYNSGVKLVCEPGPVLDVLSDFELEDVEILSCGTCLNHFELSGEVKAGQASNMVEIQKRLFEADKVVYL